MGVIIYSFNLNISPKMSYGVPECDTIMLQNYMLMIFVIKDFVMKKGCYSVRPVYSSFCWVYYSINIK